MPISAKLLAPMILGTALALAGCKGAGSVKEAEAKVAAFHQQLDGGDLEAIWRDSGPDIQSTDKKAFERLLGTIRFQLGNVRESKQVGWRSVLDTAGSQTVLVMDTTFERGSKREEFVFKGSGDQLKLAGYHIK